MDYVDVVPDQVHVKSFSTQLRNVQHSAGGEGFATTVDGSALGVYNPFANRSLVLLDGVFSDPVAEHGGQTACALERQFRRGDFTHFPALAGLTTAQTQAL